MSRAPVKTILPRLIGLYRASGLEPMTGYSAQFFGGYPYAPFTTFIRNKVVCGCNGLALQEIMFLEGLCEFLQPRRILVIGNSYGWSTLALALMFPEARVVGIDPVEDGNSVTNEIARRENLNAVAVKGLSPQNVGAICAAELKGACDLVLVDAVHTNKAMLDDFNAAAAVGHEGTLYVFHDVLSFGMLDAYNQLCRQRGMTGHLLTRTASGMAILYKGAPPELVEYVKIFTDDPDLFRAFRSYVLGRHVDTFAGIVGKL
jgi:predicted O-methyltransferase YrrM